MGKLKGDELNASRESFEKVAKKYLNKGESRVFIDVLSSNNTKIFSKEVPIIITFDNQQSYIEIFWECVGIEDYKDKKLYGRYNPFYNKMKISSKNTLRIDSSDSDRILVVHY